MQTMPATLHRPPKAVGRLMVGSPFVLGVCTEKRSTASKNLVKKGKTGHLEGDLGLAVAMEDPPLPLLANAGNAAAPDMAVASSLKGLPKKWLSAARKATSITIRKPTEIIATMGVGRFKDKVEAEEGEEDANIVSS